MISFLIYDPITSGVPIIDYDKKNWTIIFISMTIEYNFLNRQSQTFPEIQFVRMFCI